MLICLDKIDSQKYYAVKSYVHGYKSFICYNGIVMVFFNLYSHYETQIKGIEQNR